MALRDFGLIMILLNAACAAWMVSMSNYGMAVFNGFTAVMLLVMFALNEQR